MFDAGSLLWRWLADQPAYIEVAIGIAFVLVLAPAILAGVAVLSTRLEAVAASVAVRLLLPDSVRPADQTIGNANQGKASQAVIRHPVDI